MQKLCILGATGSIGLQTLDIVDQHQDKYEVIAFSSYTQVERSLELIKKFKPKMVVMGESKAAKSLQALVESHNLNTEILSGPENLSLIASLQDVDTVIAGITGAAGLPSVLAAAKAGKKLLLANKEALVMTGPLLMDLIAKQNGALIPLDSEHNALFQCIQSPYVVGTYPHGVEKLILTASGGPFLHQDQKRFEHITPEQAIKHPNWSMGANISIDCATMMNKGLEVIEAHFLFNMPPNKIEVIVHPESIVHSMVVYKDGSYLAQMGTHDMRIPISFGLGWPDRLENRAPKLDLAKIAKLHFISPDYHKFPCLRLAFEAIRSGGIAPVVLNASNEEARAAFIDKKLSFNKIPEVIEKTLEMIPNESLKDLDTVFEFDHRARHVAMSVINKMSLL